MPLSSIKTGHVSKLDDLYNYDMEGADKTMTWDEGKWICNNVRALLGFQWVEPPNIERIASFYYSSKLRNSLSGDFMTPPLWICVTRCIPSFHPENLLKNACNIETAQMPSAISYPKLTQILTYQPSSRWQADWFGIAPRWADAFNEVEQTLATDVTGGAPTSIWGCHMVLQWCHCFDGGKYVSDKNGIKLVWRAYIWYELMGKSW